MRLGNQVSARPLRDYLPRRTVRLRLTLLYGSLFLVSGAVLLFVTDLLWGKTTGKTVNIDIPTWQISRKLAPPRGVHHIISPAKFPSTLEHIQPVFRARHPAR